MKHFSWNKFDLDFISKVVYSEKTDLSLRPKKVVDDKDMLIPTMDLLAPYPTRSFIMKYRAEIESNVLINHPDLVGKICKDLKISRSANYRSSLNELSKLEMGNSLISSYETALLTIGNPNFQYEFVSPFRRRQVIDLNKGKELDSPLYNFQEEAIRQLNKNLVELDNKNGLLVMPTGSGKTRTAVQFLLESMVSSGYQVIWLAHRHMLLDQCASSFRELAPLVKKNNSKAKELRIICVSGIHSTIRAAEKNDDIIIISTQSGYRGLDYLSKVLSKKVIIVVDECHHTVAPTYRRIIEHIRKHRKDAKLLGLTATPIRGTDDESRLLHKIYDNNIIYQIPMAELITKKTLATPKFERIETNTNFEPIITVDEENLIKKFGELPESLISKIAESAERNRVIIDTYIKDKERFGKTLIFALNGIHCHTLNEELRKRGVKSDYVYFGNNDNASKIRSFKNNELDVLININILTEGSDVPNIQTIFLTRPTQSEGLLMQMIGRGMRGVNAGGTEYVNIVDFCDKWDIFNKWLNPKWIFDEEEGNESLANNDPDNTQRSLDGKSIKIPWSTINDLYKSITLKGGYQLINDLGLPYGWYSLSDLDDNDYTMLVWANQLSSYREIVRDKKAIKDNNLNADEVITRYFSNFVLPPTKDDMEIFLFNLKNYNSSPSLFKFEDRYTIDHIKVYESFIKDNVGINDMRSRAKKIYDSNKTLIDNIYDDFDSYYFTILEQLKKPEDKDYMGQIEEIPFEFLPYEIKPTHNLNELMNEVIDEMFLGHYDGINSINWTKSGITGYYGLYQSTGHIQINKILDSPQVDREVIKFLIYHELLHRDYRYHDKDFYREEHKYPNYIENNRFLDGKIHNYNLGW